jgi:hypothetical protein
LRSSSWTTTSARKNIPAGFWKLIANAGYDGTVRRRHRVLAVQIYQRVPGSIIDNVFVLAAKRPTATSIEPDSLAHFLPSRKCFGIEVFRRNVELETPSSK